MRIFLISVRLGMDVKQEKDEVRKGKGEKNRGKMKVEGERCDELVNLRSFIFRLSLRLSTLLFRLSSLAGTEASRI